MSPINASREPVNATSNSRNATPSVRTAVSAALDGTVPVDVITPPERLVGALAGFQADVAPLDAPAVKRDPDGSELVLVPAGFFWMGQERRSVYLDGFYVDRYPVTNRQFAAFLGTTAYRPTVTKNYLSHWRDGRVPTIQS